MFNFYIKSKIIRFEIVDPIQILVAKYFTLYYSHTYIRHELSSGILQELTFMIGGYGKEFQSVVRIM